MVGAILNVAGILAGGAVGLTKRKFLSPEREAIFKVTLGAFTVFYGLRLTWISINGSFWQVLKQLAIVVLALMLGKFTGHLLRLQKMSNRVGQQARASLAAIRPGDPPQPAAGFKICAALFCAAPLAILGSIQDGLAQYLAPLAIKGVIDGLATIGFIPVFGWGVVLAALPVLALEGTITLVCAHLLAPFLAAHQLIDAVNATGGLVVFSVALVMLGLRRIELADYLPSLLFAPLLTWLWR